MPVNEAKQRIRDRRNKEIYAMYTNEKDPKSYAQISRILLRQGVVITPAGIGKIIRRIREEQEMSA